VTAPPDSPLLAAAVEDGVGVALPLEFEDVDRLAGRSAIETISVRLYRQL
jgi:hypothetical protein